MAKSKTDITEVFSGDEIAIKDLIKVFWDRRIYFIVCMTIMLLLAVVQIVSTKKYFSSVSKYITEQSPSMANDASSGFSELLGLPSKSKSQGTSFSDPSFFPTILGSQSFLSPLMKESFYFEIYDKNMTLKEFVLQYDDNSFLSKVISKVRGLPQRMFSSFQNNESRTSQIKNSNSGSKNSTSVPIERYELISPILELSSSDLSAMSLLAKRIDVSFSGNIVTISTEMPDALVCAQLNQLVSARLLDFVIENETEKERRDLEFLERRVISAKENFQSSQKNLAIFKDKNQGVISAAAAIEQQRLQSEYNIFFEIYRQLASDLENKKVALEEKVPVFTVFEPVYVPVSPVGVGSVRSIVLFLALGFVLGGLIILIIIFKTLFK